MSENNHSAELFDYIAGIKNKKTAVIGAGISNRPLIKLLLSAGMDVTVCDMKEPDKITPDDLELISRGAKYRLGESYLDNLDFDLIFRTPGLMPFDSRLKAAADRGAVITSEMEAFLACSRTRNICITGSDGKTTTSTIIAELLKAAG